MTSHEIIVANLTHANPPRPGLTFDNGRINDMVMGWTTPDGYTEKRWREGSVEYYDDVWGNLWQRMIEGPVKGEIVKPAIEDWSQLDAMPLPRYDVANCAQRLRACFADNPGRKYKLAGIGGWIFDNARYLRKMEVYFLDLALYPEEVRRLHDKVATVYEAKIHAAGQAGADGILIGEDMGTQQGLLFSPAMFRDYFKPLYTRLMGLAHEYGMSVLMHSCGRNWEIVDDLLDCGVNAFQFDQPLAYDFPALAAKLRARKAALWSPIDIQKVLPTGDKAFIERETRRMIEAFRGGLILKNYPDLPGIGVKPEWDRWAYEEILRVVGAPG